MSVSDAVYDAASQPGGAPAGAPANGGGKAPWRFRRGKDRPFAAGGAVGESGRDAWVLVLPVLLPVVLFSVYPLARGIYIGFTDKTSRRNADGHFNGLENYRALMDNDLFWAAFRTGIVWALSVTIIQFVLSLWLALLLNMNLRFRWVSRTLALVPWAMPPVIVAIMWRLMLNPNHGPVNRLIEAVGGNGNINWLVDRTWALPAVVVVGVWSGMPQTTITLLAALQQVDDAQHEAAAIDGAGTIRRFVHITFPAIAPTVIAITTLDLISAFNAFGLPYVLTQPTPVFRLPAMFAYDEAFRYGRWGMAAAMGNVMVIFVAAFLVIYLRSQAKYRQVQR